MLSRGLVFIGLLILVTTGCESASTATTELTPELEAQIVAHDAAVAAEERSQP